LSTGSFVYTIPNKSYAKRQNSANSTKEIKADEVKKRNKIESGLLMKTKSSITSQRSPLVYANQKWISASS
jgi:hypothetical protein